MERRETERWRVLALEVKCASCCDDQTPFLRPNSFPVTLRMKNNSTELPGFLQILITIDKIFSDQDRIQNIKSLAETNEHLSPSLRHRVHDNTYISLTFSSRPLLPPLTTCKTPRIGNLSKTQFILWQYFSLHAHNLYILLSLRRGVQDSTVGKCRAELAWCIINQYWKERLRRVMFCRNFSSAAASWVAEREAPLSLPVIHHQTTRNLTILNNRPVKGTIPNKPTMIKTVFLIS